MRLNLCNTFYTDGRYNVRIDVGSLYFIYILHQTFNPVNNMFLKFVPYLIPISRSYDVWYKLRSQTKTI